MNTFIRLITVTSTSWHVVIYIYSFNSNVWVKTKLDYIKFKVLFQADSTLSLSLSYFAKFATLIKYYNLKSNDVYAGHDSPPPSSWENCFATTRSISYFYFYKFKSTKNKQCHDLFLLLLLKFIRTKKANFSVMSCYTHTQNKSFHLQKL